MILEHRHIGIVALIGPASPVPAAPAAPAAADAVLASLTLLVLCSKIQDLCVLILRLVCIKTHDVRSGR